MTTTLWRRISRFWCNGSHACLECYRSLVQVPTGSNQRL